VTESKKVINIELEVIPQDYIEEEIREEPPKITNSPINTGELDLTEKKRSLRRWRQSFGYYCLNPEKFRFTFRDL
jgi:hypothetical protein